MAPQRLLVSHFNDDDMNWMLQWQYSHGAYFFSKNCYIFIFCSLHGFMPKPFVEFCCHWHFWIPFNSMKWNLPTHSLCLKKNAVDMFYSRKKNRAGHGHISNFLNLGKFVCIVWTFLSSECKKKIAIQIIIEFKRANWFIFALQNSHRISLFWRD